MSIQTLTSDGIRWKTSGLTLEPGVSIPIHSGSLYTIYPRGEEPETNRVHKGARLLFPNAYPGAAVIIRSGEAS
jgi:hypothetical protein